MKPRLWRAMPLFYSPAKEFVLSVAARSVRDLEP